jgi:hypothetical protein
MNTITRLTIYLTMAIAIVVAPTYALLAHSAVASAAPTMSAIPVRHHGGPNYWSITGARVGAPNEREVSSYGGSHKHLWVEQQLYGPDVVEVPHVDTSVHQSH